MGGRSMAGHIRFRPEAADYVAATRTGWLKSLRSRPFAIRMAVFIAIIIVVAIAITWSAADFRATLFAIAFIGGVFFTWLAACLGLSFLLIPRRSRRLFEQQRTLHREFDVEWTDDHLVYRSDTSTTTIAWPDYYRWLEGRGIFLFYLNEQLYHFVPKRALTAEQLTDPRNIASASVRTRR